jgi:pimeloyl-ACP methyl ester carboxylesterase
MLTDTAICDQYAWLYSNLQAPAGTWDHVIPVDGAYCAIKRVDGVDYVMFRGSLTFMDWYDDLEDFALPVHDAILGDVHPGFLVGVKLIKDLVDALVGDHVVVVGHSLGAGHAALYSGYRVAAGKSVDAIVMFGEPRAGGSRLSEILAKTTVRSYRNGDASGHDYVTDVPPSHPPELPYQHVRDPLTDVCFPPPGFDPWLAFRFHHFWLYARSRGCGGAAVMSLVRTP